MGKTLGSIGEAGIIQLIARWLSGQPAGKRLLKGIGDDCATLPGTPGPLLLTTDAFVENVHFRRAWTTPAQAGWKAMAANVSDIAAAGGTPLAAVISLELPAGLELSWLKGFYSGLLKSARRYRLALAGGNISRGPRFSAHITLTGAAPKRRIGRAGARPGHILAVTGQLGESRTGLLCLKRGIRSGDARRSIRRHLLPNPNLAAGRLLAQAASALIDISDGLIREARLLAQASNVRLSIDPGKLPVSPTVRRMASALGLNPIPLALASGEEYELLACLPRRAYPEAVRKLARRSIRLTMIGEAKRGKGVYVSGRPTPIPAGFDHFR